MAQKGFIFKKGGSWFLKYRDNVIEDGVLVKGKQRCSKLAPVNDTYRAEKDLQSLRDEILGPINSAKVKPESTLSVAEYGENQWLPWVRENCKPSTIAGYEYAWRSYLSPCLLKITLRDFEAGDAYKLLADLHRQRNLGKTALKHCKSVLSGVFSLAQNQKVLKFHPLHGSKHLIPNKANAPGKTHKAKPDEVLAIMDVLEKAQERKARAAVALMYFAGLRPGEARGVEWQDYDGKRLTLRRSIWHKHITTTKTDDLGDEPKQVPVIEPLADILGQLREADGNPSTGPVLRGPSGKPANLDNLAKRVLAPLLKAAKIEWHGWYSLRRGVATTLRSLTGNSLASKGLLRHSSTKTTERFYIEDVPEDTLEGMNRLEALFNECSTTKH